MSSVCTSPTPTTDELADQLRIRLLALNFPAFADCICQLLEALGYEDAKLAGRREWKGYNRPGGGGYDLETYLPGGLAPRRVVAQIKQFDALTVHQRSVDELRGACLRVGAAEGLLVTTSAFSEVVRKRAASPAPASALIAPVRLIDGEELVSLLIHHRLGVRERGLSRLRCIGTGKSVRKLMIDETFFRGITVFPHIGAPFQRMPAANADKQEDKPPAPDPLSLLRSWRVTVHVTSVPKQGKPQTGKSRGTRPKGRGRKEATEMKGGK